MKPLPPHKAKQLVESFNRHLKDLQLYEAKSLSAQELRELLKDPNVWVAVGVNRWT